LPDRLATDLSEEKDVPEERMTKLKILFAFLLVVVAIEF
jgi:hypothetical protein